MKQPILIGIAGRARSGKDTTADFIEQWCDHYESTYVRESFARRLKESAAHALGVFEDEVEFCNALKGDYERGTITVRMANKAEGPNAIVKQITGREFLQFYGTEAHRDVFSSDFWVDAVLPITSGKLGSIFKEEEFPNSVGASSTPIPDWWENFLVTDENTGLIIDGLFEKLVPADYCLITDCRFENEAQRIRDLGGQVWKIERDGAGAGNHASEQELPGELVDLVIDNNGTLDDLKAAVTVAMEDISGITAAEEAILASIDEEYEKGHVING